MKHLKKILIIHFGVFKDIFINTFVFVPDVTWPNEDRSQTNEHQETAMLTVTFLLVSYTGNIVLYLLLT